MVPFTFQPNHTVPTGLSAVPPVDRNTGDGHGHLRAGMGDGAQGHGAGHGFAHGAVVAISPAGTPSSSVLASLE